jgi:hypothetical protein
MPHPNIQPRRISSRLGYPDAELVQFFGINDAIYLQNKICFEQID